MSLVEVTPGVHFAYTDSGLPSGKDVHTTLVVIHGYGWNADVFNKVVKLAPEYGIRVITFHRRDYGASSPYTEAELSPLKTASPDVAGPFMESRALELANFIQHVVTSKAAVAPRDGHGGISVLGWSLGNLYCLDWFSRLHTLPDDLQLTLKEYVRSLVIFDPPFEALDLLPPTPAQYLYGAGVFNRALASRDPADPARFAVAGDAVVDWLTGWFEYEADAGEADPVARYVLPNERPPVRASTRVREAENPAFMQCNQFAALPNEDAVLTVVLPAIKETKPLRPILFSDPEKMFWPGMRVEFAYCANSLWTCVYTADTIRKEFEAAVPGRHIHEIKAANHFVQWEDPANFLDNIVPLL